MLSQSHVSALLPFPRQQLFRPWGSTAATRAGSLSVIAVQAVELQDRASGPPSSSNSPQDVGQWRREGSPQALQKQPHVPGTLPDLLRVFFLHPTPLFATSCLLALSWARCQSPLSWLDLPVAVVGSICWVMQEWFVHARLLHSSFDWLGESLLLLLLLLLLNNSLPLLLNSVASPPPPPLPPSPCPSPPPLLLLLPPPSVQGDRSMRRTTHRTTFIYLLTAWTS